MTDEKICEGSSDTQAHKKHFLEEIRSSRVLGRVGIDCEDSIEPAIRSYWITDVRSSQKRNRSRVKLGINDEHDLDKRKVASLDPRILSGQHSLRLHHKEEEKIQGMLYKTSRGITSSLKRGQNEHRQQRRFQLTEHSLEYSQLLQTV